MKGVRGEISDNLTVVYLEGRIDSNNAAEAEKAILEITEAQPDAQLVIDAEGLEYISSAGLRVILHLLKTHKDLKIINVDSEVYEILDMTGFTEMVTVEKAYRVVSVEGCEVIGQGANGIIYRIDQDIVVKVYKHADALEEIRHEREVAKKALILGIPTAISYDVVRVGDSYGSVFELLNAQSFSQILAAHPEKLDWCVDEYVSMLKKIHGTLVPKGDLPAVREQAVKWAEVMRDYLSADAAGKVCSLIRAIPEDDHMIHGDYHTKNLELTEDEVLLIDMDTLAVGHPILELAPIYSAFVGYGELDPDSITDFQGYSYKLAHEFWHKSLSKYLGTTDEKRLREVEDKARVLAYVQMIGWEICNNGLEDERTKEEVELWTKHLLELLPKVDSLVF